MTRFADASFFAAAHAERLGVLHPGARVLEFNCGSGATGALALREGRCASWTGIDPNAPPEALYALSEVLPSAEALPDAGFDVVFATADDLASAARLLAPGGWLYAQGASARDLKRLKLTCIAATPDGARGMRAR